MADASDRDSGSDNASSDEDSAGLELSDNDMKSMLALEEALAADPKSYDNHVQYIALLRRANLKERLKTARRAMHQHFPMTEELWLEWVADEGPGAELPHMAQLYELAVADYLSVPVWRSYLEYMQKAQLAGSVTAAEFRELYERALNIAGLHVTLGSQLWALSRDWEMAQLAASPSDVQQLGRVRALFHRQLQVPLADGASTLDTYQAWESSLSSASQGGLPPSVKQNVSKAQSAAKLRAASEAAVAAGKAADHDLLAAFTAYLKLEEASGDAARLQLIYERALVAFPVTSHLWLQYARFVETKLKIAAVINGIYERASRNCPWVGAIWARRLYALERGGAPDGEHAAVYASAISAGLQTSEDLYEVVLARIDAVRRRQPLDAAALRATFTEGSATLQASLGESLDPALRVTAYWADCEAHLAEDVDAARAVWEAALRTAAGRNAELWLAFIAMERGLRNLEKVRSLYKRCYARQFSDGSQVAFCQAWLRFEREEGSADDQLQASLKVEPILNEAAAAAAAAADAANAAASTAAMARAPLLSPQEMRQLRQQKDPNFGQGKTKKPAAKQTGQKRQQGADVPQEASASEQPSKRSRNDVAESAAHTAPSAAAPSGDDVAAPMQTDSTAAPTTATKTPAPAPGAGADDSAHKRAPVLRDDSTTVFVKNMNFKVTDKELWDFFTSCGTVTKVAVKRDDRGNSKGFAFVHFSSQDAVPIAIAKSGTHLRGRPLVIEASQPLQPRGGGGRGGGGREGGRDGGGRAGGSREGRGGRAPGRDGGRGRHGGGRGRGDLDTKDAPAVEGLGGGTGRGGWASSGSGKQKLDLKQPARKGGLGFMPRAVAVKPAGDTPTHPALQNKDFRAMLLSKKSTEAAAQPSDAPDS